MADFDIKDYIYGLSDVSFTNDEGVVTLPVQADAAVLTVEPKTIQIMNYELGLLDEVIDGYNITFKMVFDTRAALYLGLPLKKTVGTLTDLGKINYVDAKTGTSLRTTMGGELVIHPRNAGASVEHDMTIFKAVPSGTKTVTYGKEKTGLEVTFTAYVKDSAEAGVDGNYFRIGPVITA